MRCTLAKDINTCPFFIPSQCTCSREEQCSFQKKEEPIKNITGYVRKERWYEKYYKNGNNKQKK